MSLLSDVLVILLNGLQQGAIYVLLAVGLSIILGRSSSSRRVMYFVAAQG